MKDPWLPRVLYLSHTTVLYCLEEEQDLEEVLLLSKKRSSEEQQKQTSKKRCTEESEEQLQKEEEEEERPQEQQPNDLEIEMKNGQDKAGDEVYQGEEKYKEEEEEEKEEKEKEKQNEEVKQDSADEEKEEETAAEESEEEEDEVDSEELSEEERKERRMQRALLPGAQRVKQGQPASPSHHPNNTFLFWVVAISFKPLSKVEHAFFLLPSSFFLHSQRLKQSCPLDPTEATTLRGTLWSCR